MAYIPNPNQSVSGTVGASVIGLPPVNLNVGGNPVTTANPVPVQPPASGSLPITNVGSVITVSQGSVATVIIGGSIAATFTPPANQSVSGTVHIDNFSSVIAYQLAGSVLATSATVTPAANQSVSGTVGASIIGLPPVKIIGSVVAHATNLAEGTLSALSLTRDVRLRTAVRQNVYVSSVNSTTTNLLGTTTFTGTSEDALGFGAVQVNTFMNKNGAVQCQQSMDNTNWDIVDAYSVLSGVADARTIQLTAAWARVLLSNNDGTTATVVRLQTAMAPIAEPVPRALTQAGNFKVSVQEGSIFSFQSGVRTTSIVSSTPSSVLVGASIFGQLPAGTAVLGSVATLQGTNPWIVTSSVAGGLFPVSGSVATVRIGQVGLVMTSVTGVVSVLGTVPVTQSGTWSTSVLSQYYRNDTLASVLGADLTAGTVTRDSQGRTVTKPFVSNDGTLIEYQGSVVSGSVQLIQASVLGKRNYVTDIAMSNTGGTTALLTLQGGDTSILGQYIVPTGGGNNVIGINIPLRGTLSQDLAFKVSPSSSVVYINVRGYQAQ